MSSLARTKDAVSTSFAILRHPHRRRILTRLMVADDPETVFTINDLVRWVDEFTNADEEDDSLRLYQLELVHLHLPKLDDAGYVSWDNEAQTVERGVSFGEVEPLLEVLTDHEDALSGPWV